MMKKYDVVIVGSGSAGITARNQVSRRTENYIVVDPGPFGTTCARVGCMPSKAFIQVANDFHKRKFLLQEGIEGAENLSLNSKQVLNHVRALRDRFVGGVLKSMADWDSKLIKKTAQFIDEHTLDLGDEKIFAEKIILATGSRPWIPSGWEKFKSHLATTDELFEKEQLPQKVLVMGLGAIGIEMGQALSRLGVEVIGSTQGPALGGISDPEIQNYLKEYFSKEFPIYFEPANPVGIQPTGLLRVQIPPSERMGVNGQGQNSGAGFEFDVDAVLVSVGRRSNLDRVGLEKLGVDLKTIREQVNPKTMELKKFPHIFIAGDSNQQRSLLHEAADEGSIAGFNAVAENPQEFLRRVPINVTFSEPELASVGKRFSQLQSEKIPFVEGKFFFEHQSRAIIQSKAHGLLKIYAHSDTGLILGAEMQAPAAEHMAHHFAVMIDRQMTILDALRLPFYHPVVEEGLRAALRSTGKKLGLKFPHELLL